jgi:hypothetical protein
MSQLTQFSSVRGESATNMPFGLMKLTDEAQRLGAKEVDSILISRKMMLSLKTNIIDLNHYQGESKIQDYGPSRFLGRI